MDWHLILLGAGPGLILWSVGLVVSRRATDPLAARLGSRLTTAGFALVILGLVLLLVLSAVLSSSGLAA